MLKKIKMLAEILLDGQTECKLDKSFYLKINKLLHRCKKEKG